MRPWTPIPLALVLGLAWAPAWADQITLDSGAIVEGSLAAWQQGGECWFHLSEGALAGTTLVVDCARVLRFERRPAALVNVPAAPIPDEDGLPVEAVPDRLPPISPPATSPIQQAPSAQVPVVPIEDGPAAAPAA